MNRNVVRWLKRGACLVAMAILSACDRPAASASAGASPSIPASVTRVSPLTDMVPIPAGSFLRLKYPVTISSDFWIGRYEVTQAEFLALMGKNPSKFTGDSNRPVEKVSYVDAVAFCEALNRQERSRGNLPPGFEYRLPTEAEWEYACRAGSTNRFSFGNDLTLGDRFAWTAENCEGTTHPVGKKEPNAWGLYDMHGNVWEWCQDWFEPYKPGALVDPAGPVTNKYKVFKGGGWNQDLQYGSASSRFMMAPSNGIHFVGFRVVLSNKRPVPSQ